MYKIVSILVFVLISLYANAQSNYLIQFEKKEAVSNYTANEILSTRALEKRSKKGIPLKYEDLPIRKEYLDELKNFAWNIKVSKWLNSAIISTNLEAKELAELDFIKNFQKIDSPLPNSKNKIAFEEKSTLEYGSALQQIEQVGIDCIHDNGFFGEDVIIAVLDGGFRGMDTIPAFDSLYIENRLIDIWDFVDNDSTVYEKSTHGTRVSSVIGANQSGYVGAAPKASLCLYITEDISQEVNQEEFNLVMGLERADSVGADIVNISLSYFSFDSLQVDYDFIDLDGSTTISALGIEVARNNGILVVTSAGNSGPSHITTPCDSDSILCVGATNLENILASFSSLGPTADGRIKPDIAAAGQGTSCVNADGSIGGCNGTSFSSPLVAGLTACLVEGHPDLSIFELIEGIKMSGHQATNPDNFMGFGIPNACIADSLLNQIEVPSFVNELDQTQFNIYPNPSEGHVEIIANDMIERVEIFSLDGRLLFQKLIIEDKRFQINLGNLNAGVYMLRVNDAKPKRILVL